MKIIVRLNLGPEFGGAVRLKFASQREKDVRLQLKKWISSNHPHLLDEAIIDTVMEEVMIQIKAYNAASTFDDMVKPYNSGIAASDLTHHESNYKSGDSHVTMINSHVRNDAALNNVMRAFESSPPYDRYQDENYNDGSQLKVVPIQKSFNMRDINTLKERSKLTRALSPPQIRELIDESSKRLYNQAKESEQRRQLQRLKQDQEKENMLLTQLTFKPDINPISQKLTESRDHQSYTLDRSCSLNAHSCNRRQCSSQLILYEKPRSQGRNHQVSLEQQVSHAKSLIEFAKEQRERLARQQQLVVKYDQSTGQELFRPAISRGPKNEADQHFRQRLDVSTRLHILTKARCEVNVMYDRYLLLQQQVEANELQRIKELSCQCLMSQKSKELLLLKEQRMNQ